MRGQVNEFQRCSSELNNVTIGGRGFNEGRSFRLIVFNRGGLRWCRYARQCKVPERKPAERGGILGSRLGKKRYGAAWVGSYGCSSPRRSDCRPAPQSANAFCKGKPGRVHFQVF